jgi:hypothetical protein
MNLAFGKGATEEFIKMHYVMLGQSDAAVEHLKKYFEDKYVERFLYPSDEKVSAITKPQDEVQSDDFWRHFRLVFRKTLDADHDPEVVKKALSSLLAYRVHQVVAEKSFFNT